MESNRKINYVEFPAADIEKAKEFYSTLFNWEFTDYGPEYTAFTNAGLEGGFFKADKASSAENGSALIVLYAANLEEEKSRILAAGGDISVDIFSFPGGRRFQFLDPNGNELAVWSEN